MRIGSRDPTSERVRSWLEDRGPDASAGTLADAAIFAELAVLATAWRGVENAIQLAGPQNLASKVVIDVTNPFTMNPGGLPLLTVGHTDSGGEQVQRWLSQSKVVKAFNIIGSRYMVNPHFPGGPPDMFICGNDPDAKRIVAEICADFGWSATDIGGIEGCRMLEPLAQLWVTLGAVTGRRNHAFKVLNTG